MHPLHFKWASGKLPAHDSVFLLHLTDERAEAPRGLTGLVEVTQELTELGLELRLL